MKKYFLLSGFLLIFLPLTTMAKDERLAIEKVHSGYGIPLGTFAGVLIGFGIGSLGGPVVAVAGSAAGGAAGSMIMLNLDLGGGGGGGDSLEDIKQQVH